MACMALIILTHYLIGSIHSDEIYDALPSSGVDGVYPQSQIAADKVPGIVKLLDERYKHTLTLISKFNYVWDESE